MKRQASRFFLSEMGLAVDSSVFEDWRAKTAPGTKKQVIGCFELARRSNWFKVNSLAALYYSRTNRKLCWGKGRGRGQGWG